MFMTSCVCCTAFFNGVDIGCNKFIKYENK